MMDTVIEIPENYPPSLQFLHLIYEDTWNRLYKDLQDGDTMQWEEYEKLRSAGYSEDDERLVALRSLDTELSIYHLKLETAKGCTDLRMRLQNVPSESAELNEWTGKMEQWYTDLIDGINRLRFDFTEDIESALKDAIGGASS